uniref:Uncharacterized protein n=1 Tax=Rhizophora mucronata TaxID=61149 RepID=A0A2P2QX46_RHIMU
MQVKPFLCNCSFLL